MLAPSLLAAQLLMVNPAEAAPQGCAGFNTGVGENFLRYNKVWGITADAHGRVCQELELGALGEETPEGDIGANVGLRFFILDGELEIKPFGAHWHGGEWAYSFESYYNGENLGGGASFVTHDGQIVEVRGPVGSEVIGVIPYLTNHSSGHDHSGHGSGWAAGVELAALAKIGQNTESGFSLALDANTNGEIKFIARYELWHRHWH